MHPAQLGGNIGPFNDPTSGQSVGGTAQGTFSFAAPGDPNAYLPQVQAALLAAITSVIGQKLASNQVAIPTIAGSLPYFVNDIIAAASAQLPGVQIADLQLSVNVQNPYAAGPGMGAPMPPDPMTAMQNAFAQRAQEKLDPRNYEYAAKINVGGFKIKASTDGGIDTDGLKNQVKDKVKTEIIWYGIGCVIVGIVIVGLLGLAFYIFRTATGGNAPTGAGKAATWDGKSKFSCSGNDNVKLEGVTATIASGEAISAIGNCKLELSNVNITAPDGISAMSNAKITMKGGSVTAKNTAAQAMGSAQITFQGTKVTGKKSALGANAKIIGP
ncbi:MAG: hypothetical protein IPI67_36745 [Myxococcales bacterium]|nr:hypothetical protein [Myxococcales bacterium]